MIGLGIDAAKKLAGDSNEELAVRLEATSRLSKTAIPRHTTGIERPRCVDRLPSHISKTVVSTVRGGGRDWTRTCAPFV